MTFVAIARWQQWTGANNILHLARRLVNIITTRPDCNKSLIVTQGGNINVSVFALDNVLPYKVMSAFPYI